MPQDKLRGNPRWVHLPLSWLSIPSASPQSEKTLPCSSKNPAVFQSGPFRCPAWLTAAATVPQMGLETTWKRILYDGRCVPTALAETFKSQVHWTGAASAGTSHNRVLVRVAGSERHFHSLQTVNGPDTAPSELPACGTSLPALCFQGTRPWPCITASATHSTQLHTGTHHNGGSTQGRQCGWSGSELKSFTVVGGIWKVPISKAPIWTVFAENVCFVGICCKLSNHTLPCPTCTLAHGIQHVVKPKWNNSCFLSRRPHTPQIALEVPTTACRTGTCQTWKHWLHWRPCSGDVQILLNAKLELLRLSVGERICL